MRVSNFLFPQSLTPGDDARVIDETLREAILTDELGFDVIWLAEHHFDGICAYVDPVAFAAAARHRDEACENRLRRCADGPASSNQSDGGAGLSHRSSVRGAIDRRSQQRHQSLQYLRLSKGFGLDHTEAQARFEEAEAMQDMFRYGRGEAFKNIKGQFFNLKLPAFRPIPFTKPHPYVIRAAATEHGMLDIARMGRPFMMNVQSNETTSQRMDLYRQTLRGIGLDEAVIAANSDACWAWRECFRGRDGCLPRRNLPSPYRRFIGRTRPRICAMREPCLAGAGGFDRFRLGTGRHAPGAHEYGTFVMFCGSVKRR